MKYTVDEIINNIVTLIDYNGCRKYENINIMPTDIGENDIVIYENNEYKKIDNNDVVDRIKNKMDMLRSNE